MRCLFTYMLIALILASSSAIAKGDFTYRATRLDPLLIDANDGFSSSLYSLETGVYYRLRFVSDGRDEYTVKIPDLFKHSWIDRIVIEDVSIPVTSFSEFTLESEAELDIYFVPLRTGSYVYYVDRLRSEGFEGEIVIQ